VKIHPVGAELFRAKGRLDRQTDRHEGANSHFSQFCDTRIKHTKSDPAICLLHICGLKNKQLAPSPDQMNPTPFFTTQFV